MQHMGTNSIETLRLILCRFEEQDAQDMYNNWAKDPEVCKYLPWGPHLNLSYSQNRIRNYIRYYENNNAYIWAIYLKNIRQVIGSISVEISNESQKSCEIGYCIGKDFWNRGIMTEALRAVMHYLFYEVGYTTIRAKHDVLNVASGKVMQKAGMEFDKIQHNTGVRRDGSIVDCAVYKKSIDDD